MPVARIEVVLSNREIRNLLLDYAIKVAGDKYSLPENVLTNLFIYGGNSELCEIHAKVFLSAKGQDDADNQEAE